MTEADRSRARKPEHAPQLRAVPAELSDSPYWSGLADAGNPAAFCSAWLALQCTRIPGVAAGLLIVRHHDEGAPLVQAGWPDWDRRLGELQRLAEQSYAERRIVVVSTPAEPGHSPTQAAEVLQAVPLGAGGQIIGVVAVRMTSLRPADPPDPKVAAEQLRWGAGWLEALPWARRWHGLSSGVSRASSCMDFLATIGEQPRLLGMVIAVANDLAIRLRCDRVSIGTPRRNGTIRVRAISHSATFKNKGRLVDAIENAMEEAIDQRRTVTYPPLHRTDTAITMAHRALADNIKVPGASLATVPLAGSKGGLSGAITVERHRNEPFDNETMRLAEALAAVLGPIIELQCRANKLLSGRIVEGASDALAALLGPRRPALKLGAIGSACVVLALAFATGEHRIAAKSVLEAETLRAAVAPFEGFIRAAPVRAGDNVAKGDLLAALDDRDLILDRSKWRAERDMLLQRQRDALARHDRVNLVVLESQVQQAEAQLALAEEKLSRAMIVAPFDGIVVSGDFSQMLGSPVEKGKTLFEIAPRDIYRLIVQVDERDVRYVAEGQRGTVALAGMPWTPLPVVLGKITPVTAAEEGRNFFRVEARLAEIKPNLRPGMEGVTRIDTGQRPLLWIWSRAVIEWLRLAAWKYLP